MTTIMEDTKLCSIEDLKAFLAGTKKNEFRVPKIRERYPWMERILQQFNYFGLTKKSKGVVFAYLRKRTGYSRQQVSRLIQKFYYQGKIEIEEPQRHRFPRKYTPQDVALLLHTDNVHARMSGPATKKIMEREYDFGHEEYEQISQISIAHIYNLRQSKSYQKKAQYFSKTHPISCTLGERAIPRPEGRPGFLRVDTVHQGDQDQHKGVYHINTIDEVTQFQIIACVPQISELYMLPVLKGMLQQYPFTILEFHSDNGSEYINHSVVAFLNKLLIRLTKSRARHPNDNALVESKNGSILRKRLGYGHIPAAQASHFLHFFIQWLNPYINFHRPCLFAKVQKDARGKEVKHYPYTLIRTPYQKLRSLPKIHSYLKKGVTLKELDAFANEMSDNDFALKMHHAQEKLWDSCGF
jgi:transposase InsO family protein